MGAKTSEFALARLHRQTAGAVREKMMSTSALMVAQEKRTEMGILTFSIRA